MGFVRKHLSSDGLHKLVRDSLGRARFKELRPTRYSWPDCLMSGLALFGFKMPSSTLKNQGYRFEHNDGHGYKNLCSINNEYSHLAGIFERGSTPVEVPEMQTAAKLILQKIKERDSNQYSALLQSIGVTEEPAEEPQTVVEAQ